MSSYCDQLLIDSCIAVILAVGLGITYGHTGILSLCHATFFGAGAYAAACCAGLTTHLSPSAAVGVILVAGVGGAALVGGVVAGASLPLRGDFVALATLALGELLRAIVLNTGVLGGPGGIRGIPSLTTPGLAMVVAFVSIVVARVYLQSPWGRLSEAVRDAPEWAKGLAVPRGRVRFASLVFGASLAGAAGALYAYRQQYIHPNSFGILSSITILLAVIVGGRGNLTGCVLGALLVALLPEALRSAEEWRPLGMGIMLLATSAHFTHGILGRRLYLDPLRRWPRQRLPWPPVSEQSSSAHDCDLSLNAVLRADSIVVRTPHALILDGATLQVHAGQPLALVGPNGSGKTILAKALAGIVPSYGALQLDGEAIPLHPRPAAQMRRIVYVPQHPNGFHRMSALDNVHIVADRNVPFPACLATVPFFNREREARSVASARSALEWVGLADKAQAPFATLSYGQRKRILLAAALLANPEVLILDEPFAGLNSGPGSEAETVTQALAARLASDRHITLIIDHRLELIQPICSTLALLDTGRIVHQGPMAEAVCTPLFKDIYERTRARG